MPGVVINPGENVAGTPGQAVDTYRYTGTGSNFGPPAWSPVVTWSASATYYVGPPASVVTRDGGAYVAVNNSTGIDPATDNGQNWQQIAEAGTGAVTLSAILDTGLTPADLGAATTSQITTAIGQITPTSIGAATPSAISAAIAVEIAARNAAIASANDNISGGSPGTAISVLQLRHGPSATWTSANPVLASGELGYETDTLRSKLGDGSTSWTGLAYVDGTVSGGTP